MAVPRGAVHLLALSATLTHAFASRPSEVSPSEAPSRINVLAARPGLASVRPAVRSSELRALALNAENSEINSEGEVGDVHLHALASRVKGYEQAQRALKARLGNLLGKARMQPAGWFGAFSEEESTFDEDGWNEGPEYPELTAEQGWDTAGPKWDGDGLVRGGTAGFDADWFDESKSGGPKEAWQTHFPALQDGENGGLAPPWRKSSNGQWQQHYQPTGFTGEQAQAKPAAWFDSVVNQFDAYGRKLQPDAESGRNYIDWNTVTKSANLTCAAVGCVANASITLFDGVKERAKHCRLTVKIHPTDFDDDWSKETVAWVRANDMVVNTNCDPMASGCNATTQAPLFPCLTDYDLTQVIDQKNGTLHIAAKITDFVDECPMNGFLLNGVVTATCFVAPKKNITTTMAPPMPSPLPPVLMSNGSCPLQCAGQNCTATCTIDLDTAAIVNRTCKLKVTLNQTDFDQDHGSVELVEWIKVDGTAVATNVTPGKNPCNAMAKGTPLTKEQMVYTAVSAQDVTAQAANGTLMVSGKITPKVDECASNGFLLDAIAFVNCTL